MKNPQPILLTMALLCGSALAACTADDSDLRDEPQAENDPVTQEELFAQSFEPHPEAYNYPLRPGDPEWAELDSIQEMRAALQVPDETLSEMSTEALIDTCMRYPLFLLGAYADPQTDFNNVVAGFNGFQELLQRADAGDILLKRYQAMDPSNLDPTWSLVRKGAFGSEYARIELLLAQQPILERFSTEERNTLGREALRKAEGKASQAQVFGGRGQARTALVVGRILKMNDLPSFADRVQEQETLRRFIDTGEWPDPATIDEVLTQAELVLSNASGGQKG